MIRRLRMAELCCGRRWSMAGAAGIQPERRLRAVLDSLGGVRGHLGAAAASATPVSASSCSALTPVLDLRRAVTDPAALAQDVHEAFTKVGWFFLSPEGHGIPLPLIDRIFGHASTFLNLPDDTKRELQHTDASNGCGYHPLAELVDIRARPRADGKPAQNSNNEFLYFMLTHADGHRNLWPDEQRHADLAGLADDIAEYTCAIDALAARVMKVIAAALELPPEYFESAFGADGSQSNKNFRMSRYPPSDRERVGFVPHTDSSVLTLIAQSDKQGIELCPPSGKWHRPPVLPGAILVHGGDMLRRWTNHHYLSTLHRVVNLPDQERFAVPVRPHQYTAALIVTGCTARSLSYHKRCTHCHVMFTSSCCEMACPLVRAVL
jgi:isopenicillin N synthase-like dioxygenase